MLTCKRDYTFEQGAWSCNSIESYTPEAVVAVRSIVSLLSSTTKKMQSMDNMQSCSSVLDELAELPTDLCQREKVQMKTMPIWKRKKVQTMAVWQMQKGVIPLGTYRQTHQRERAKALSNGCAPILDRVHIKRRAGNRLTSSRGPNLITAPLCTR